MKFRVFNIKMSRHLDGANDLQNTMNMMHEQGYELVDKFTYNIPQGEGYNDEVHLVATFKYTGSAVNRWGQQQKGAVIHGGN